MKRLMVLGAAAALVLAGCASDPPQVSETPSPAMRAAVSDDMAQVIIDDTFTTIAEADAALDASLLDGRVTGDAATVRAAEYAVAKAVADAQPSVLPEKMQSVYVTNAETWPRVMAAVSEPPSEKLTPIVYVWVQEEVDSPYELRGWAHMIPGATLPAMPGDVDGATQLPLGESGVDPSPRAALEGYLEFLRQGPDSEHASDYAPDTYAQQLFAARESLSAAAAQAGGAYVDTVQPDLAHTYVLSTSDGGALVIAPVQITSSFSVSGATLTLSEHDQPLLDGSLTTKATYTYRDLVVMSVPAPGKGDVPAVVAAEHHLVSVKPE